MAHVPVLVEEVLKFLDPKPGQHFIDCTLGDGGHTRAILERTAPNGTVLAFDLDPEAVKVARENLKGFSKRLIAVSGSYTELAAVVKKEKFGPVSGVLMDFGFSSAQLHGRGRGFSFQSDEALDMRYSGADGKQTLTAAEIVNTWPKPEIVRILAEYGEERLAARIAQAIVTARREARIIGTGQLVNIIVNAVSKGYEHGRIHPATRTFQALRIAVNDELGSIETVLPMGLESLAPGGTLVAISFHSLEDRIVKNFFKDQGRELEILTAKPLTASDREIASNPRARSAKLRAAKKK